MNVTIKTPQEQDKMRVAGRLAAEVLLMIEPQILPGVTTDELDRICHDYIVNVQKAIPAPLNYRGFPKSICTSVNHVVCHGIPGPKALKKGDMINIDITVIKDGWHGDTSKTFFVGEPSVQARRLSQVAHDAMCKGIEKVRHGTKLGDIGAIIQQYVEKQGFSVVREYCGHGIGRIFHEDPQVLHYGSFGTGMTLQAGMTITIEPMVNAGRADVKLLPDGWTVVTKDHSLSAQWEHTVLVTEQGFETMTLRDGEMSLANDPALSLTGEDTQSGELFGLLPGTDVGEVSVPVFRQALEQSRLMLYKAFESGVEVENLVTGRARLVDELLTRAWTNFLGETAGRLSLIAVGGYGRGELLPYSDVDVLVLHADSGLESVQSRLEHFLTFLWDIGLEIGHSVRSPAECAQQAVADVTVITNLMESRLLSGDSGLFQQMRDLISPARIWPVARFFEAKLDEQHKRHAKFQDSAYKLEPNVKESPGGLRDIQTIAWVAMRHFGTETLHDLVVHGFLTEQEYGELLDGQRFLWRVRFALHRITGRREDRLLFDHQAKVAAVFGFRDHSHNLAVEQFMQGYYRSIKALSCLNDMLLQLFQEAILHPEDDSPAIRIGERFQARHGYIELRDPDLFRKDPSTLLEIFLELTRHRELKGIRAETLRLIRRDRVLIDDNFRQSTRARGLFMEMLRQPRGITHELRRMNRYGVLGRYLPAFGQVIGMMQYDLFHTLTVDEHVLFVVRNMRRLALPEFEHELPYASQVFSRLSKPEVLYLAGLFHDIAKGRGGDHSELGSSEAEQFCLDHGLPSADCALVAWLVRAHLVMSLTAQRRDITDPKIIHEFAERVGDQTHLDYLFLLTVCDIRATNPNLWNSWRSSLLTELYEATSRALDRGLHEPIGEQELISETRAGAHRLLSDRGVSDEQINHSWGRIEDEFFLRHSSEEIAWQTQAIAETLDKDLPLVLVDTLAARGTTVFVYTKDVDYLFGLTTAVLARLGLTILDARISATRDGYTLDSYVVMESDGQPIASSGRQDEIQAALRRAISNPDMANPEIGRRIPRQLKHFTTPTQIFFNQDPDRQRTIMEIVTGDRPGLLSTVGTVFRECRILVEAAKIGTIGERAEDVFFITNHKHQRITDPAEFHQLRQALTRALEPDLAA